LIIAASFVLFVLFLRLTAGHHKHRLEQALNNLETERMKLMKSIEHVKLAFYKKQIGEKEAQDKIFELEEKLKDIESKILNIKEKPLLRTINKQALANVQSTADNAEVSKEGKEIIKSEKVMLSGMSTNMIALLFIILIIIAVVVVVLSNKGMIGGTTTDSPLIAPIKAEQLPLSVTAVPTDGTAPGSSAGIRIQITNAYTEPIHGLTIIARSPEGSGVRFEEGYMDVVTLEEFEVGGSRDLFFYVLVDANTPDGDYVMNAEAVLDGNKISSSSGKLAVRIGRPTNEG